MKRSRIVCAVALAVAIPCTRTSIAGNDPRVVPPTASFLGKTYGEWSAAWWQWVFSFPSDHDPLTGTADCGAAQSGKVWFLGTLGGAVVPTVTLTEATASYTRQCTVPRKTWLFVPVINGEQSAIESCWWGSGTSPAVGACDPTVASLQADAKGFQDLYENMSVEIDGAPIAQIDPKTGAPFRIQAPQFAVGPLPPNNRLKASFDIPRTTGASTVAAADGVYVMLKPLPRGPHTIHVRGGFVAMSMFAFMFDYTYQLTVDGGDACSGAKLKAIANKESGLLGCAAKATATGSSAKQAACEASVRARFAKAFTAAGSCAGDVAACEGYADACESSVVTLLTDALPSSCESQKQKAAGSLARAELGCYAKAASSGATVNPACLSKAALHFTRALTKAGTCPDGGTPQTDVETACVHPVVTASAGGLVTDVCATTSTSTTTSSTTTTTSSVSTTTLPTCGLGADYPTCGGSCPPPQACTALPAAGLCGCQ